jgi:hypothetical protein
MSFNLPLKPVEGAEQPSINWFRVFDPQGRLIWEGRVDDEKAPAVISGDWIVDIDEYNRQLAERADGSAV